MYFLFNRTTLQVFVTYLTGALYVHPLWFYKHQHDNRVRSKLFVSCQRWWFQWRFSFLPSVPGYLREEEEHKPDPWHNPIERNHMGLHLQNEVAVVKTPTVISNFLLQVSNKSAGNNLVLRKMHISAISSIVCNVGRKWAYGWSLPFCDI